MATHRRTVTLDDVAMDAGVSRATVSRVINSSKFVEPSMAERVRATAQKLGYVPNQAARSLTTRRNDMVALVVTEPSNRFFHDPFFADIARGVSQELAAVDMRMLMAMIETPEELHRFQQYLLGRSVDGVLVISEHAALQMASVLPAAGVPMVLGGRPMNDDLPMIAHVDNDNRVGARMAAEHLKGRGAQRIATIAGPQDMSAGIDRLNGFRDAFDHPVAPERIVVSDFTLSGGVAAMETLLTRVPDVDAVFVASDLMALGAMQVLRRMDKRVPEDIAIVGFDDIDLAAQTTIPLTTIRQEAVSQGRLMVRLLLRLLGREADLGKAARRSLPLTDSIVLPVSLIRRASA